MCKSLKICYTILLDPKGQAVDSQSAKVLPANNSVASKQQFVEPPCVKGGTLERTWEKRDWEGYFRDWEPPRKPRSWKEWRHQQYAA